MISASPDYMNSLSQAEQRRFFEESVCFKGKVWRKNLYASVHVDEKHLMHVGMVPVNEKQNYQRIHF